MIVTLNRFHENEDGTYGVMVAYNRPVCVTLEDVWRENKRTVSCIPVGRYECVKHFGEKYKDVWILKNVPDRSAILIHAGNTEDDTQGCILVGKQFGTLFDKTAILDSKSALNNLKRILPNEFTLIIKDIKNG